MIDTLEGPPTIEGLMAEELDPRIGEAFEAGAAAIFRTRPSIGLQELNDAIGERYRLIRQSPAWRSIWRGLRNADQAETERREGATRVAHLPQAPLGAGISAILVRRNAYAFWELFYQEPAPSKRAWRICSINDGQTAKAVGAALAAQFGAELMVGDV